jgi:cytoskeletal protein RodZ
VSAAKAYQGKKGPSIMAQTPQSEETGGTGDTAATGQGSPQGLFGSSTTILLIIFAVAVFWWNRRRRVAMEEQLRAQRREAEATAERSALDVANLMRAAPRPGERAAAASEGLASAAPMPSALSRESTTEETAEARTVGPEEALDPVVRAEAQAREIERAEGRAAAERAAEEQAARATRGAQKTGESVERRMAAASSAADEAAADTTDAAQLGQIPSVPVAGGLEREDADAEDATGVPRSDSAIPVGAVAGNGTAICPPDYPIKGNRQSRIYHRPGQVSYPSTVAEYCFASEEAAESAGFRQSRARGQRNQPH